MMKVKKIISALALTLVIACAAVSCKSKISDADLKTKVEAAISAEHSDISVDAKDGVITLSGTVGTDTEKQELEKAVKNADEKNVKSVVNNIVVETPQIETSTDDTDLISKVTDATKDFPTVKADVKDGVITVTGSLEQARVQTLKMALDALHPKKVDMSALTVK